MDPMQSKWPPHWFMTLLCGAVGIIAILYVRRQAVALVAKARDDAELATNAAALMIKKVKADAATEVHDAKAKVHDAEAKVHDAEAKVHDADARAQLSETAKDTAVAELRCELGSFTVDDVLAMSTYLRDQFLHLCSKYSVPFALPDNYPDNWLAQVRSGDLEVATEATRSRDGRACEGTRGGSLLQVTP